MEDHSSPAAPIPTEGPLASPLATCQKCGAMAVWEMAPCDSFGEYCDDCVPRGCSCNTVDFPATDVGEEHRDERGRLLPCCEYDFLPDGFPPGDPKGPAEYRARFLKADANSASVSPAGYGADAIGGMSNKNKAKQEGV